jgi:hypothetical protein
MNRAIFILFILALFASCNKEEEKKLPPELSGFTFSECGGFKSTFVAPGDGEVEKLTIRSEADGYFKFDHTNVSFNCCLPAGISANLSLSGDTLFLNEKETEPGNCRCLCSYDLTSEIKNLEEGNYVLCLVKDSIIRGTITLLFNKSMYEEILISELIE